MQQLGHLGLSSEAHGHSQTESERGLKPSRLSGPSSTVWARTRRARQETGPAQGLTEPGSHKNQSGALISELTKQIKTFFKKCKLKWNWRELIHKGLESRKGFLQVCFWGSQLLAQAPPSPGFEKTQMVPIKSRSDFSPLKLKIKQSKPHIHAPLPFLFLL